MTQVELKNHARAIKDYCNTVICPDCPFYNETGRVECKLNTIPAFWLDEEEADTDGSGI